MPLKWFQRIGWKGKLILVFLFLLLLGVIGQNYMFPSKPLSDGVMDKFLHAASFEACSLDPTPSFYWDPQHTNANSLLGYKILGQVQIGDLGLRRKLLERIGHDIANAHHPAYSCVLVPHHGIRCNDGTNTFLMAICYTCGDVLIRQNGVESEYLIQKNGLLLDPASKRLFEQIFSENDIKTVAK